MEDTNKVVEEEVEREEVEVYDSPLEELLVIVTKQEDYYYDLAIKEMYKNNILANQILVAQAGAYQRVRYTIEDMIEKYSKIEETKVENIEIRN